MKRFLLLRALPLLAAAVLCGCSSGTAPAVPELLEPVDFRPDSAVAEYQDIVSATYHDGELVPEWEELAFPADGVISAMEMTLGRRVSQGELLCELDTKSVREEIAALEEELSFLQEQGVYRKEQALISQEIARTELARLGGEKETLDADLRLKELEIERLKSEEQQAEELLELTVRQKKSRIAVLESQLSSSRLTAPCSGQILAVMEDVYPGAAVAAYSPVAYLADESSLLVQTAYISETSLTSAERIYARTEGGIYELTPLPMDAGEYLAAIAAGDEVKSRFTITAPDEGARMGAYANVAVVSQTVKNVLAIPSNALYRDIEGSYVYLIENEQQVRRGVETGLTNELLTEIRSGLQEGDVVYVKD